MDYYHFFQSLLKNADIELDGNRAWDIKVNDPKMFNRIVEHGSLGLGESYIEKQWECDDLAEMISRLIQTDIESQVNLAAKIKMGASLGKQKFKRLVNSQTIIRAKADVSAHYDLGNHLYESMLDPRMTYTCGYWKQAQSLSEAQEHKLDLLCRKLGLSEGMRVLDIGCGWGSFMNFAAEKYGVICDGLTLSKEQATFGQNRADISGLPVNFILQDYREYRPNLKYDAVVSVGMIEHVGPRNYREYFDCVERFMKDEAIFVLHGIGSRISMTECDPWINKYIFPNGVIPSLGQLSTAMEPKFNIEDVHNFGPDYDKTLSAWYDNFLSAWPGLQDKYGDKFFRIWRYYLLSCAGAFRARDLNLWQIAMTKVGRPLPNCIRES